MNTSGKKLTKGQLRRLEIVKYLDEQRQEYATTLAVENTAAKFDLTVNRIWQIVKEENERRQAQAVWD